MAKYKEITLKINKRSPETTSSIPVVFAKDLPTLISDEQYNILTEGDEDPFIFAQAIEFPVEGNGDIYDKPFFESFLEKNKERPFPGDKYGHSVSWYKRQPTHFNQIGGEIRGNIAYFKFYVPPETDSESNKSFKKEILTNGVDLSLVSKVSYKYNEADNKYYILSSEGSERNDAVGYGEGSMDQAVMNKNNKNKENLGMDEILKKLNALREEGNLTVPELLRKLNAEKHLKTEEDRETIKKFNSLVDILGEDPIAKAKDLTETIKKNAEKVREAAMSEAFGPKINKDKTENLARQSAELILSNKEITDETIKEVKENPIYKANAGRAADYTDTSNTIIVENKDNSAAFSDDTMEL